MNVTKTFVSIQRVFLEPYDPCWAEEFARESSLVTIAMGNLLVAIHHIGSTAIPGMHAKPVIDMLAAVRSYSTATAGISAIVSAPSFVGHSGFWRQYASSLARCSCGSHIHRFPAAFSSSSASMFPSCSLSSALGASVASSPSAQTATPRLSGVFQRTPSTLAARTELPTLHGPPSPKSSGLQQASCSIRPSRFSTGFQDMALPATQTSTVFHNSRSNMQLHSTATPNPEVSFRRSPE